MAIFISGFYHSQSRSKASLWPQAIAEACHRHLEHLVRDAARTAAVRHRGGKPTVRTTNLLRESLPLLHRCHRIFHP